MQPTKRLLLALAVLFAGLALVPYVALPNEAFSWRLFANIYGAEPALGSNYTTGAPGSSFTITGYNFLPGQTATIAANGRNLTTIQADESGSFSFVLATDDADAGRYRISANGAALTLELFASAPLRLREAGDGVLTIFLPAGIAENTLYLPEIRR
jgi:hypothetical protein